MLMALDIDKLISGSGVKPPATIVSGILVVDHIIDVHCLYSHDRTYRETTKH